MRELRSVPSEVKLEQDPQSEAAIALAAKGASAVPFLIAALDDKESQVRLLAAWALGEIGDGRSAGALALRLGDGDGFVRAAAMTALVQTGPSAVNALLEALTAEDAYPRQLAACALGAVGDRRATGGLSALVEDVEPGVRRAVAEALGRIGGLEATGLLVRLLGDEDPVVRRHTVWALRENLTPEQLGEELEGSGGILIERLGHREEKVRTGATDVLARLGEPAAPLLIRALASGDGMVRRQAAEALWHMQTQDHRAAEPLLAALEDVDGELRAYAAGALGGVGDHRAVEPLIAALKDDHARVRELAVEALGRLGDERAIPALATVLHDEKAEMRREAVASLEEIGPAALDPLMTALHDEDRAVRTAAAASLGRIGDPRAVGSLVAALEDLDLGPAPSARRRRGLLIAALGQMRGNRQAIEALVHLLEVIPRRDHYTLNPVNRALQNATGEHVYSGLTYAGNQAEPIVEGWQTWLAASGAAGHPDVTGEDRKDTRSFKEAMKAGLQHYHPAKWWDPMGFAAARATFEKALEHAQTDSQRAAALLAIADSRLYDYRETDCSAICQEYSEVLALGEAPASERAQAALGIGEAYLRQQKYDLAREQFARAGGMSSHAGWAPQVQFALAKSYLQQRRYGDARREFSQLLEMEGMDARGNGGRGPQGQEIVLGWEARALLASIRHLPRLRQDHPRLFFNSDTWPAVRARALGQEKERFVALKSRSDGIEADQIETSDWGMQAMEAAFVYRVTGEEAVLEKVRRMLRASVDHYLLRIDPNAHGESRVACVVALDWVWNDLQPSERMPLVTDLIDYVYTMYVEDRIRGNLGGKPGRMNYYERNLTWYAGLAVLDSHLDDVYHARALAILGRGYLYNQEEIGGMVRFAGDDGAFRTSLEYYFAATLSPFWSFLYCWQSALDRPIPESMANVLSSDYVLRNALGFKTGFLHFGYGRSWRGKDGMYTYLLRDHLAQMVHFFGESHPRQAAIARHVQERMEEAGLKAGSGKFFVYPFLRDPEQAPPAGVPPNMPIARHFERVGQILMSSGFGPDDTYALFSCGGNQDEAHFDSTHFTIYKQGYLALDSGTRAQAGESGTNYDSQTVAHNAVLIRMPGEVLVHKNGRPIESNSGGQRELPSEARLLAFETNPLYAYAATDATPTYHQEKCTQMVRQFIYLPPDHFVVFDRVASTEAEYPKTWLLHTANEPVIAGREFRADQDQGRIFCRTLYPTDAVLDKIGGPGKEFWADGRNWPIPADSPYLGTIGTDRADHVPENIGRWRVEVKPGRAREADRFLHLIQASDRTVEQMVSSQVSETAEQLQVTFTAGTRAYTLSLEKTGAVGGHIRIQDGEELVADRDLTRGIMPQAGLALTR